jgi:magnesium transporter
MLKKFIYKKLTWIDLESPTKEEVRQVMDSYDIHPIVAEELLQETIRPRVDYYGSQIYLILHFPTVNHTHTGKTSQEIDFVIGKNFLVTVHYETVDPLLEFSRMLEVNSILDRSNMGDHAGFLFFYLVRDLYKNLSVELNSLGRTLSAIEDNIFKGNEKTMVEKISRVNRKLIDFKMAIRFHKDVLESFELAAKDLFGEKFSFYTRAVSGEYYEASNALEGHRETLSDLWSTNDSLLSNKTNEIMKIIAMISFVTFPLSLIAAIFGMNTHYLPIVGAVGDFWIVMSIMLVMMLGIFAYFKHKRWF